MFDATLNGYNGIQHLRSSFPQTTALRVSVSSGVRVKRTTRRSAGRLAPDGAGDSFRLLAEVALSSAHMCGWDWDMVTGADTLYGDTRAIFGTDPGSNYDAVRRLIHPDDLGRVEHDLADAAGNHRDFDGEFRVVHPDGSVHWIHGRGKFSYQDGKAVRMVGVNVDITEQKHRERELAEAKADLQAQKALLETIVDHVPIMLCYMREPGKVHWVNRTWEDTLGWTPADNG